MTKPCGARAPRGFVIPESSGIQFQEKPRSGGAFSFVPSRDHSALIPASRMTFPHFAISASMNAPNYSGLLPTGTMPIWSKVFTTSGMRTMAAISEAMRFTIAAGVPAGASTPA